METRSGQKALEKMLNITNHQRNANQKYNKIAPHIHQESKYKKERERERKGGRERGRKEEKKEGRKEGNNKCWQQSGEIETLVYCWGDGKIE